MSILLLICCLLLSGGNSCSKGTNNPPLTASVQSNAEEIESLLREVKMSDEPALRVFLRLKIAAHLWKYPDNSHDPKAVADDARTDLDAHAKEIPDLYVNLFRREIISHLKAHAPEERARPADEPKPDQRTDLEVAYSLLNKENGVDKAVALAQRSIADGNDPGPIITFFLNRLDRVKSAEVPKVLGTIMSAEEAHHGSILPSTLFTLKHLFIREQTPQELRRQFLAAVIRNAADTEAETTSLADTYAILADVMPVIEKELPDVYPTANIRLTQLAERVPAGTRERIDVEKRVSQSIDPLAQLLIEIDAVNDTSLKADLQAQAGRLALEKGQTRTAIDIVVRLQPKTAEALLWREQFLEKVVARALGKGNVEVAEYGAAQIQAADIRSSALQKIALYYIQRANDVVSARNTLDAAFKLLKASENGAAKAGALLDLADSYVKVDSQRTPEVIRAAVKVINETPEASVKSRTAGGVPSADMEKVMMIAYRLIPAFQAFAAADKYEAKNIANDIQRQELKTAAKFGVYTAPPVADKPKQGVASN